MSYAKQVLDQTKKIKNRNLLWGYWNSTQAQICKPLKTFHNIKCQTDTELSNKYWNIISTKKTLNIFSEMLGIRKSYNESSKLCFLCLNEKLAIVLHKDDNMLNKRPEVISKCRQRNKYALANYDRKD